MDVIRFHCPYCTNELVVPPEAANLSGPCPYCNTHIQGPGLPQRPPTTTTTPFPSRREPAALPHPEANVPHTKGDLNNPFGDETKKRLTPTVLTRNSGIGLTTLLMVSLVSSLAFGVLGFFLGRTVQIAPDRPPIKTNNPNPTEAKEPSSTAPKATSESPATHTPPHPQEEILSSGISFVRSFLEAPDMQARAKLFLDEETTKAEMKTLAAERRADGPIPYTAIEPAAQDSDWISFIVTSEDYPDGFLIDIVRQKDEWKIDWPSFAETFYRRFEHFVQTPGPDSQPFRVFIRPAKGEPDPKNPARVQMTTLNSDTYFTATLEKNAREQFSEFLAEREQINANLLKQALAGDGVPLVLIVSKDTANPPALKGSSIAAPTWWSFRKVK